MEKTYHIKTALTFEDFLLMEKLEQQYYPIDFITPARESYAWYLAHPDTYRVVFHKDTLVGFMNLFSVSPNIWIALNDGSFNDRYLTADEILKIDDRDRVYPLFLSCIVVDEGHRQKGATLMLLNAYVAYFDHLIEQGFQFSDIITDNVTEAGLRFSKKLGLEVYGTTSHGTTLCRCSYRDLSRRIHKVHKI